MVGAAVEIVFRNSDRFSPVFRLIGCRAKKSQQTRGDTTMTTNQNVNGTGLNARTSVKAGGSINHNQSGIAVRSQVKAGGLIGQNHNQTVLFAVA
jgi:hypothetical protein